MFDLVHDSQAVHRALVLAFSFPGTPVPVSVASVPSDLGLSPVSTAVALTLLDPETTFWSATPQALTEYTGAPCLPPSQAAFLFVVEDSQTWGSAFREARRGTLADPHLGATVVVSAPTPALTQRWKATGPGIEGSVEIALPEGDWVAQRALACIEFPLGVDLIWAQEGSLVALPRTTQLQPIHSKEA